MQTLKPKSRIKPNSIQNPAHPKVPSSRRSWRWIFQGDEHVGFLANVTQ